MWKNAVLLTAVARLWAADINALVRDGLNFSAQGQYDKAAKCYREALAIDPKLAPVQLNLGLAEFKRGRFGDAVPPLKAALALEPDSFQARTLLGMSYYGARRYSDAVTTLAPA